MAVRPVRESIQGRQFNDVLNELHAHTLPGVPGESDPFTLSELEREYIAYSLALYYQCEHCRLYHGRRIETMRGEASLPKWEWQADLIKLILFLRVAKADVSEMEWQGWLQSWRHFAVRIHLHHPGLACTTAYAIGIARADETLMSLAFTSLDSMFEENDALLGAIRDIDRVVVFMKAATSKNRTDPLVRLQLAGRGIRV